MTRRLQVYQSPGIVVTYYPNLCTHAAVCVRGLPLVFDASTLELPSGATQARSAFALCRCGRTRETPFRDGSHATVGFRSRS